MDPENAQNDLETRDDSRARRVTVSDDPVRSRPEGPTPPFPIPGWQRYRPAGYLGAGGMGLVFRGFDPRLDRHVALKFIRGGDPRLARRFQQEARAQARVEHDNVCKVYEVGEFDGQPYIAMQLIDGVPLSVAALDMTLEQKLLAVKQVAEGLHEAHRAGLIHRDVKPANIMVERLRDGSYKPFVMDFGLARDQQSPGMTRTGEAVGTPLYMPPEQALGEQTLDRRSDVYGLGVTLYSVLSGKPPFADRSAPTLLESVLHDVPDPLHRSGLGIPLDVDSIVLKCLRKKPAERYGSARELAEDIGRYLDGEPVHARRTSALYRLRMKLVKHRVAVALGCVALAAVVVAVGWAGTNAWNAAQRTRLARDFGRQVERIESLRRYSHMLPLHDVRPERARIEALMKTIETRMEAMGAIATGPGQYALGRGQLNLGRFEAARARLEAAWEAGYREPEVALALGQALGELYRSGMRQADAVSDAEARRARREDLRRTYLEPAAAYLALADGAGHESPAYGGALLAFFEQRHDDALRLARDATEESAWIYEAHRLIGDIQRERAVGLAEQGRYAEAQEQYEHAAEAYRSAVELGRSDPGVHTALCGVFHARMRTSLESGAELSTSFAAGRRACQDALVADPELADAHGLLSALHRGMGEDARNRGRDPSAHLDQAIDSAERAVALDAGGAAHARVHLGHAFLERARHAEAGGEDPDAWLESAARAFAEAIDGGAGFVAYNRLGIVLRKQAAREAQAGSDPRGTLDRAIAAYRRSIELSPQRVAPHNNIGIAFQAKARYEQGSGAEPGPSLGQAIAAYEKALSINPEHMIARYNLGRAYADRGHAARSRGDDPRPLLRRAADTFAEVIARHPESTYLSHFHNARGSALNSLAVHEQETGGDPRSLLAEAFAAFEAAIDANPGFTVAHLNVALTHVDRALYDFERGEDPRPAVTRAIEAGERALAIDPRLVEIRVNEAQALWIQAGYELERRLESRRTIERGVAALDDALERNAEDAAALFALGRLHTLDARRRVARDQDPVVAFDHARDALDRGLRLAPEDADGWVAAAAVERWRATWQLAHGRPAESAIGRGLEQLARCHAIHPRHAEGMALRGDLLLLRRENDPDGAGAATAVRDARVSFARALEINANLKRRYEPSLARAETLAGAG